MITRLVWTIWTPMSAVPKRPLNVITHSLAMKYWCRLCIGARNVLLNEYFEICKEEHLNWLQCIKYILNVNGFRDFWINPIHTCDNFHTISKHRLNHQFMQEWKSNVMSSKRFTLLSTLFNRYEMGIYLTVIKNPDIRNIHTRLRIDMNGLPTSRNCKKYQRYVSSLWHWTRNGIIFYP